MKEENDIYIEDTFNTYNIELQACVWDVIKSGTWMTEN